MRNIHWKRFIGGLMALCLLMSVVPVGSAEANNKLTIAVGLANTSKGVDNVWFWKWARDNFDIDFDLVEIAYLSTEDWKSLAFASDDLPDMILGVGFSTDELVNYGSMEGQIIDLSPYVSDPEVMPNLAKLFAEHPEYKTAISDAEGRIWGLGAFRPAQAYQTYETFFVHEDYLHQAGYEEIPDTMEGIVEMLKAIKALGNGVIPCEGFNKSVNISNLILNAAGVATSGPNGVSPALKYTNGQEAEVILPYGDEEIWTYYLTVMHELFTQGLITDDYYTQTNSNQIKANVAEGKSAMICHALQVYAINEKEDYTKWKVVPVLTSAINDTPVWPEGTDNISVGGAVITSKCENVELACQFIDWFFDEEHMFRHKYGFLHGDERNYEFGGFYVDDNGVLDYYDFAVNKMAESAEMYMYTYHQGFNTYALGYETPDMLRTGYVEAGKEEMFRPSNIYDDSTALSYTNYLYEQLLTEDVLRPIYPKITFFDSDTALAIANLKAIIDDYVASESAKFITGVRSMEEIPNYFEELDALGFEELLSYYVDYYEAVK